MNELAKLRLRGLRQLVVFGQVVQRGAAAAGAGLRPPERSVGSDLSLTMNVVPTFCAVRRRYDFQVGAILGINAAVQPALLVYMLQGHAWQMEGHMYFFVGLAALTLLCDWRPIAVAVGVIAVHHVLLSYVAPEWVFIGSGDFLRVHGPRAGGDHGARRARAGDDQHGEAVRRAIRARQSSEESAKSASRRARRRASRRGACRSRAPAAQGSRAPRQSRRAPQRANLSLRERSKPRSPRSCSRSKRRRAARKSRAQHAPLRSTKPASSRPSRERSAIARRKRDRGLGQGQRAVEIDRQHRRRCRAAGGAWRAAQSTRRPDKRHHQPVRANKQHRSFVTLIQASPRNQMLASTPDRRASWRAPIAVVAAE